MDVFPAARGLDEPRLLEPPFGERSDESRPLSLDGLPAPPHVDQRTQIPSLRDGGIGLARPAVQPQLLGPDDVSDGAVNPLVAAFQIAEILFFRELGDGGEDRPVRPGVVVEQLEEFSDWGLGPGA